MVLSMPFLTEADYAARAGLRPQVLHPATPVVGGPPQVFPAADAAFYGDAALSYEAPEITLTTHRHVVVRGRSNVLTTPDAIVRHGMFRLDTDTMAENFYGRLPLADDFSAAAWSGGDPYQVGYLDEAAVFTDALGSNYAHWLTEVLPRVAVFAKARQAKGIGAKVPLLLDAGLHPNILRSLRLVVGPDAAIRELGPEEVLHVGVLHNVSATGYVPFKLRRQPVETIGHGVFAPGPLREMTARLKAASPPAAGPRPKLLVRRNSTIRQMDNEPQIAEALIARGFQVVEPERLSLDEQVAVYSGAKMIVGATGAAMANLVFCQPDCALVVMMMRFRHTAYWYWRRMAAAAGAGPVFHVSGAQTTELDDPFDPLAAHQDYRVELADVLAAVDAAEAA